MEGKGKQGKPSVISRSCNDPANPREWHDRLAKALCLLNIHHSVLCESFGDANLTIAMDSSADGTRRQQQSSTQSARTPNQSMVRQSTAPYLDHNQQDLLLAALNSQAGGRQSTPPDNNQQSTNYTFKSEERATMNGANDSGLFMSPAQAHLDNSGNDFTPDLDYLGDDFDFENADLGGEMIGSLPGGELNGAEQHEKRKNPDEVDDEEEGDAKRQEGEKGSKKPGRKPLTSEPTTVSLTCVQS